MSLIVAIGASIRYRGRYYRFVTAPAPLPGARDPDLEVEKAHGKRIGGYTVSFARIDGADR